MSQPKSLFQPVTASRKRVNALVYGGMGRGKSYFALSFSKLGRVAVIDLEGRLNDYKDRFDFDRLPARDLPTILAGIEEIRRDNGKTWQTLVIDPITILWGTLQDAMQQVVEQRSIAAKRGVAADEAAAEAGFTQLEWQKIKRQFRRVLHALASLKINVIVTAYETSPKDQPTVFNPDCDKRTGHAFSTVLHFHSDTAHTAKVMKDTTGIFKLGAVINPDAELFRAYLSGQSAIGGDVATPDDEDAAIQATAKMFDATPPQRHETATQPAQATQTPSQAQKASESPPGASQANAPKKGRFETICESVGLGETAVVMLFGYEQWTRDRAGVANFLARVDGDATFEAQLEVFAWAGKHGVTIRELARALEQSKIKHDDPQKWVTFAGYLRKDDTDILLGIESERPRKAS